MSGSRFFKLANLVLLVLIVAILWPNAASGLVNDAGAGRSSTTFSVTNDDSDGEKKKKKKRKKKRRSRESRKKKKSKKKEIRWGQRRNESNKEYDRRFKRLYTRTKRDEPGDYEGGQFTDADGKEIRLWTYKGHPFIVRTDISREFTVQTTMYMEMLHREFGAALAKILAKPANVKEPVEIIVFADRGTYMRAGGMANSGGQFATYFGPTPAGRGMAWKARHYRMMQFTEGITDFAKWPKGVLKHESAHMELTLRLGFKRLPYMNRVYPISAPIWFNEGQAAVFEWWDFRKTVDENIAEIPTRGRYAPFVRRMHGTDLWKDFDYYWTINRQKWSGEGREYLNYCQAWTLIGYMFNGGVSGKRDFRRIYNLCMRVGTNDADVDVANQQVEYSRAWEEKFPAEQREEMKKNWDKWVRENVPRDGRVKDEEFVLRKGNIDPSVTDKLKELEDEEKLKKNEEWVKKEEEKRKKATKVEW